MLPCAMIATAHRFPRIAHCRTSVLSTPTACASTASANALPPMSLLLVTIPGLTTTAIERHLANLGLNALQVETSLSVGPPTVPVLPSVAPIPGPVLPRVAKYCPAPCACFTERCQCHSTLAPVLPSVASIVYPPASIGVCPPEGATSFPPPLAVSSSGSLVGLAPRAPPFVGFDSSYRQLVVLTTSSPPLVGQTTSFAPIVPRLQAQAPTNVAPAKTPCTRRRPFTV